jgi:DNA topoisomerase IA
VDVEHGFAPKYVLSKGKAKVVAELKKAAKSCDEIYLAPDPDREGEAIAWHLQETLADSAKDKPYTAFSITRSRRAPCGRRSSIRVPLTCSASMRSRRAACWTASWAIW